MARRFVRRPRAAQRRSSGYRASAVVWPRAGGLNSADVSDVAKALLRGHSLARVWASIGNAECGGDGAQTPAAGDTSARVCDCRTSNGDLRELLMAMFGKPPSRHGETSLRKADEGGSAREPYESAVGKALNGVFGGARQPWGAAVLGAVSASPFHRLGGSVSAPPRRVIVSRRSGRRYASGVTCGCQACWASPDGVVPRQRHPTADQADGVAPASLALSTRSGSCRARGRYNVTRVPRPGSLSIVTVPPDCVAKP